MQINSVYPWGRSLDEYARMFALDDSDVQKRILDCGGGPASFNAELSARGGHVISCDPLYQFSAGEIERRVAETHEVMVEKVRVRHEEFVWDYIKSPEDLGETRLRAAKLFLQDFEAGKREQRYVRASLPDLPFAGDVFDIALVSHLLLLYTAELSLEFHIASIRELLRVAREARVFPLCTMDLKPSEHIEPIISVMEQEGHVVRRESVPYEFVKGAYEMLVFRRGEKAI